ncbi:MAG: phosphomannomutase/phosphoglucomutase [Gemmatimonadota bacterium]|nr:phosphomannomutase/phosphoglucomutase [Gemmatimonadota bacterium]
MRVPEHIFREYDIRGLVGDEVTVDLTRAIGRAMATFVARERGVDAPAIALGRDVRPSSDELHDALVEGLVSCGARVKDIGVVPTPVLYYACKRLDTEAGIMLTASHNPPEYNGFKLNWKDVPLSGEEIQRVKDLIVADDYREATGDHEETPLTDDYCDMIASKVEIEGEITAVVDPANATGALFTCDLLERIGVTVERLNCEVDGTFPSHHPDPTVDRYVTQLIERVIETGAELGIGLDGDCDRIGAVDHTGRLVRGDQLTAIFARDQLERTPGETILFDVKSSRALTEDIVEHGGEPLMWKTGHSLAKKKMIEEDLVFGGEMSGHLFFFHDYWGFDDAIFAAARLCEIVSKSDASLAEMVNSLGQYPSTPEIRIETTEEKKWEVVEDAADYFGDRYDTVSIDGVRITFPAGWALLRTSNTQPVVVARAEAESEAELDGIVAALETFLARHGIEDVDWEGGG